ncbi:LpqB family beta-propeller domain-containing protein [Nocardia sp. NPDC050435]|uniref:TolB family protein n=1 Tax=Nocardia sp. NPDC050435 TaxID=3155040 RepID=UPI003405D156
MLVRRGGALRAAAVIAVLSGLLAGCGADAEPERNALQPALARPAKIAFDDSESIFLMNADGTGVARIAAGREPRFAADGTKLVFGGGSIATAAADGSEVRELTEGGYGPSFSPDGSRIVFARGGALYVMNADGAEVRRLGELPGPTGPNQPSSQSPVFSPDGSTIAFTRANTIWVMAADGTNPRPLLTDAHQNTDPVFAPDGASIVFSSNRAGGKRATIHVMDADGGNVRALTTEWSVGPAFSPDGTRIVYTRPRSAPESGAELWVMNRDGSDQRRLTDPNRVAQHASWGAGSER